MSFNIENFNNSINEMYTNGLAPFKNNLEKYFQIKEEKNDENCREKQQNDEISL